MMRFNNIGRMIDLQFRLADIQKSRQPVLLDPISVLPPFKPKKKKLKKTKVKIEDVSTGEL
jgi:hypothetical protein